MVWLVMGTTGIDRKQRMYHSSLHSLELILLSSSIVLIAAWMGSLLQNGPQRRQRWCEAGIALSVFAALIVFVPFPRPAMDRALSRSQVPLQSSRIEAKSTATKETPAAVASTATGSRTVSTINTAVSFETELQRPSRIVWRSILTLLYLIGAGTCVVFLLGGRLRLHWIESAARQIDDTTTCLPNRVRLLVSPRAARPYCYGILKPRVVLPEEVYRSEHRGHVLRHEAAHLRRLDALTRAVMNFAMPLLYLNPFYWMLRRSAILASEHIADAQAALASSVDAYSTGMIVLARSLNRPRMAFSVTGWTNHSALTKRVEWLLDDREETPFCNWRWTSTTIGLSVCLLGVVTLFLGCAPEPARRGDLEDIKDPVAGCIWSMTVGLPGAGAHITNCDIKIVSGQVTFENQPVADAEVWASGFGRIGGREKVGTDKEGHFQMTLPVDPRMATASWHITAFQGDRFGSGDVGDDGKVTIALKQGRSVNIEVKDRNTDTLVSGSRLFLADGRILDVRDGRVQVAGLPLDVFELVAAAPGLSRRIVQSDFYSLNNAVLTVKLNKGGQVHGRVVDKSGNPVGDNPVGLSASRYALQPAMQQFTDSDGRYGLNGIPLDRPVQIRTYSHDVSGGTQWEDQTVSAVEGESLEVNFSVHGSHDVPADSKSPGIRALYSSEKDPGRGMIQGRVLLPNGEPATEFELSYEWPRDWQPGEEIISGGGGNSCLFTDSSGRFEFTRLKKAGTYRLIAASPGFQDAVVSRVHAVGIEDSATAEPIEMQLKPTIPLNVVVVDETKQPIAEADIWLVPADPHKALDTHKFDRRRIHALTDSAGQVRFTEVPFADGVLVIEKAGFGTELIPWYGEDTTVTMRQMATISVQLTKPAAKRVVVFLQRDGSNTMDARTAEPNDKNVVFENVTSAKYKLSIDSNDFTLDDGTWEHEAGLVEPGTTKTVTLQLKPRSK